MIQAVRTVNKLILIISVNLQFRALVGAELMEKGYDVEGVDTIPDSLRVWAKKGKAPELILIEARGQNFTESSLALLAELDQKSILLVCAGPYDVAQVDFARFGVQHIVTKPLTVGEIVAETVRLVGPVFPSLDQK